MAQILFAFLAGILTVAAPCIILPLPIILGGSVGHSSKARPIFLVLGFITSFSAVALLINFLVSSFGLDPQALRVGAVILLALFSIFMIWPLPFEIFMSKFNSIIGLASRAGNAAGSGNLGGFVLGAVIGIVWAPCAGPILGAILTLIALQQDLSQASFLLIAYAIGAGIPMLAIAYGGQALTTKIKSVARYSQRLRQVFGIILLGLAAAIYLQYDVVVQSKILDALPNFGSGLEERIIGRFSTPEKKSASEAPEFVGISNWLNSDPLTMESLRGRVVLVDFWTYSCINCIRTLPYVTGWYDKYKDDGLVVIGVHTPEFAFEKDAENVKKAISQFGIKYPVAQDNDYSTWTAYRNRYWPAKYLIDKDGDIVYTHFGEGEYDTTENVIRRLLGLEGGVIGDRGPDLRGIGSPEMYFGTDREENLTKEQKPSSKPADYILPDKLDLNRFAVEGEWQFAPDKMLLTSGPGKIKLRFHAGKVFIVASSADQPITLKITVDGREQPDVIVGYSQLYTLFDSEEYINHDIEIIIPDAGLEAFTFTFG